MLEEEGLICSHTGAKSYACVAQEKMHQIRRDLLEQEMRSLVESMKQMGVTQEEAALLMERLWKGEEEP